MINAKPVLAHMGFSITSPSRVVEEIRSAIESSDHPLKKANQLITDITGVEAKYTDIVLARHVAQYIAQNVVTHDILDVEEALIAAEQHSANVVKSQPWAFVKDDPVVGVDETVATVVEGIDVKVAVKSDGKIKKGGKQVLAVELYKKHVVEATTPATNQEFIAILMKELGMTKAGATTYRYNMAKQFAK